jgi:hypothetical protein
LDFSIGWWWAIRFEQASRLFKCCHMRCYGAVGANQAQHILDETQPLIIRPGSHHAQDGGTINLSEGVHDVFSRSSPLDQHDTAFRTPV